MSKQRASYLTTAQFHRLNNECLPIARAFRGRTYLVGSSSERADFRDVDVRVILDDDEFDRRFGGNLFLWSLLCHSVSEVLTRAMEMQVDFQIQRRTEASENFGHLSRNPIGTRGRSFAGGGDATNLLVTHDFEDDLEEGE